MLASVQGARIVCSARKVRVIEMVTLLTIITALAVLALFAVLVFFLTQIIATLESIGGRRMDYGNSSSYLSKIAFGVRAIQQQTRHLGPEVTRLNAGLNRAGDGLDAIDQNLVETIEAVQQQEGGQRG